MESIKEMARRSLQGEKIKKYGCFTPEQQKAFEGLNATQRAYVVYRGKGYSKADSYRMAGYKAKNVAQSAYIVEKQHPYMSELIQAMANVRRASELSQEDSDLNRQIDALAKQDGAEKMLETIEGADGETAKRIQFYRDIVNGKIRTKKVIKRKNASGAVIETREEYLDDIETRIKARKELDRILGLNEIVDVASLQMGDITINIVDASKRDALEDKSNHVELEDKDMVILDEGEEDGEKRQTEEDKN